MNMANDPFTLRIFVPDGDPEGVRIIDRIFSAWRLHPYSGRHSRHARRASLVNQLMPPSRFQSAEEAASVVTG
jgi:hypothetical protein